MSLACRASVLSFVALLASFGLAQGQVERQGLLSLEDARLFYVVVGAGDPIIVIHGGPGLDHEYLRPGLDALATRSELVYYDQRGTGRSIANLEPGVINLGKFVDDVEALRQALGYERVSLLAHSFGTLIALEYASRYAERLRGVILMNPVEPGARYADETARRRSSRVTPEDSTDLARLRASEGFTARDAATLGEVYRVVFRQAFGDRTLVSELNLGLSVNTAKNGQDVAALLGASLGTIDWWDRLRAITVPTLVVHGRYDLPPTEMSRALAQALGAGTLAILDSGHFPYVEDREGLLGATSAFFATLR